MKLMDFVSLSNVAPSLEVKDKDELLAELVQMLQRSGKIGDVTPLLKSLLERNWSCAFFDHGSISWNVSHCSINYFRGYSKRCQPVFRAKG